MSMNMSRDPVRNSILGDLVRETYRFINEGDGSSGHEVISPVDGYKPVRARDFFIKYGDNNFLVAFERLPFDLNVKSVLTRGPRVLAETTQVDIEGWRNALREYGAEAEIPENVKSARYDGSIVVKTHTENVARLPEFDMRTLLKVQPRYGTHQWNVALEAMDCLDNGSAYDASRSDVGQDEEELVEIPDSMNMSQEMRMEMRQKMQRLLNRVQVPILSMRLNQYNIARRALGARVLKMNNAQLDALIRNVTGS